MTISIADLIKKEVKYNQKEPDGYLHPSTHLTGWLGHIQRHAWGWRQKNNEDWTNDARLMTGTMWHELADRAVKGQPVMLNVDLTPWMYQGWSGTCDMVEYIPETKRWLLRDYKTISAKSFEYLTEDLKEEHLWQASMYWHALSAAGLQLPMEYYFEIVYIPLDADRDGEKDIRVIKGEPVDIARLLSRIDEINDAIKSYDQIPHPGLDWLVWWDERRKRHLIKRVAPYWSKYCPFVDCPCNDLEERRVGWWIDGELVLDKDCPVEYDVNEIPKPMEAF